METTVVVKQPGEQFVFGTVQAGEFTLDYAQAGPDDASATLVSFPGSAGLEMSTAKDALAGTYRVLEINPPGWGGREDLDRPIDMVEIGSLQAEAANQLVEGGYYVLGTSMGGVSAVHAAVLHPSRILGVILEAGMAPAVPEDLLVPQPKKEDMVEASAALEAEDSAAPEYPLPPFNPKKPWATEDFVRTQMEHRMKMFRWVDLDMLPEDALAQLRDQGTPVLAMLGDQDEILKPSQEQTFAKYLPEAKFRVVSGGHDLQNTAPEDFVALVQEFLGT